MNSGQRSKSAHGFTGRDFDYLITACDNARETCPLFPGRADPIDHGPFMHIE